MSDLPFVSGDRIAQLGYAEAAAAIVRTLEDGFDPSGDPARSALGLAHGQILLMPSETATSVGVKLATIAPANPGKGLPRIAAVYLLFDAETLAPRAVLDGTALTNLRTPAVSVAAVAPALGRFAGPVDVVAFGSGPQSVGHVDALRTATSLTIGSVLHVVRQPGRARERVGAHAEVLGVDDPQLAARLGQAGVVVCATDATTPVFDSSLMRDDAVVIAVGSHEPHVRELDSALMARATVVVEDVATALREAGDVVIAMSEGKLVRESLVPMRDVVTGERVVDPARPLVFKSSGMSWEDVVVAEAVMARRSGDGAARG